MTITCILKTGLGSLIVAASFGMLCLPAKADKIIQINTQIVESEGNSNTSVQQTSQTAEIDKKKIRIKPDRADSAEDYDYLGISSESSHQDKLERYDKKNSSSDRHMRNVVNLGNRRIVNPRE
jgi:major curlin subunit